MDDNTYNLTRDGLSLLSNVTNDTGTAMPKGAKSMSNAVFDAVMENEIKMGTLDPNLDRKRLRRIIANRYAAKRSYEKRVNKLVELEKNHRDLKDILASLRLQLEYEQQRVSYLKIENEMLSQQLQICTKLNNLKEAQIAEKRMEKEWLMDLLAMQQMPLLEYDPNQCLRSCKPDP